MAPSTSDLQPLVRIAIWIATGYLLANGTDPALVNMLRTDPHVAAAILGLFNTAWYVAAKYFGWRT